MLDQVAIDDFRAKLFDGPVQLAFGYDRCLISCHAGEIIRSGGEDEINNTIRNSMVIDRAA